MIDLIFMVIFKNYIILLTIMNIYIDKDQTKKEINIIEKITKKKLELVEVLDQEKVKQLVEA